MCWGISCFCGAKNQIKKGDQDVLAIYTHDVENTRENSLCDGLLYLLDFENETDPLQDATSVCIW